MPSEVVRFALYDIMLARQFVADLNLDGFCASPLHFYAVTRALEIISEASRRLPEELRDRHPELPWRAIRDVGNFYRHQYDNVAETYVWETVHAHLAPLLAAVLSEIEALDGL
jgi:uncharacterized protein with HEPN domain